MNEALLISEGGADAENGDSEKTALTEIDRLIAASENVEAVFPVYGTMKAGKSTFLESILRQPLLPAQAQPLTSIPIKIEHLQGVRTELTMKQCDKWNTCVEDYRQRLLANTGLQVILTEGAGGSAANEKDKALFEVQERIRNKDMLFVPTSEGLEDIGTAARCQPCKFAFVLPQRGAISVCASRAYLVQTIHRVWSCQLVRLLWKNDIKFEDSADAGGFDISLEIQDLPTVSMDMRTFRDGVHGQRFSFLDTPGPNEAAAAAQLNKIGQQVLPIASGCILCVPHDLAKSVDASKLYCNVNKYFGGKTVILVLTKIDSFKGDDDELQGLIDGIKGEFHPVSGPIIRCYATSGYELVMLYDLYDVMEYYEKERAGTSGFASYIKEYEGGKLFQKLDKTYDVLKWVPDPEDWANPANDEAAWGKFQEKLEQRLEALHANEIKADILSKALLLATRHDHHHITWKALLTAPPV